MLSSSHGAYAPHVLVSNLAVEFVNRRQRTRVLHDVNLSVPKGGFASLLGPSGCGKSTLLKVLSGLLTPTGGSVLVGGLDPVQAARQRRIGLVFQEPTLMPWKNAFENVCALMVVADRRRGRGEVRERAREMLHLVGLDDAVTRMPHQLSGGMRQRVAIARALALDPEVLMMDEPFGALDAITREDMSAFLLDIWQRTQKTIVLVTHSIEEAVFLSQQVHVMARNPARIIEAVSIPLRYPRNEETYAEPAFSQAAAHLRRLLKHGHGAPGS